MRNLELLPESRRQGSGSPAQENDFTKKIPALLFLHIYGRSAPPDFRCIRCFPHAQNRILGVSAAPYSFRVQHRRSSLSRQFH